MRSFRLTRQDPIAVKLLTNLNWAPNRPPDDPTGRNNYAAAAPQKLRYFNVSDRVDYYLSEKIRLNGRFGRFVETAGSTNPTGSTLYQNQLQGEGNEAYQFAGNMTYTPEPQHRYRCPRRLALVGGRGAAARLGAGLRLAGSLCRAGYAS